MQTSVWQFRVMFWLDPPKDIVNPHISPHLNHT